MLALCFSEQTERYHHWRVFSPGSDGVCIRFDKDRLLSAFEHVEAVRHGPVSYKTIKALRESPPDPKTLPFLKRRPYKDEREYRIIYVDKKESTDSKAFAIKLAWIERITLGPWMPRTLQNSVRDTLRSIPGCENVDIYPSNLIESKMWKAAARQPSV